MTSRRWEDQSGSLSRQVALCGVKMVANQVNIRSFRYDAFEVLSCCLNEDSQLWRSGGGDAGHRRAETKMEAEGRWKVAPFSSSLGCKLDRSSSSSSSGALALTLVQSFMNTGAGGEMIKTHLIVPPRCRRCQAGVNWGGGGMLMCGSAAPPRCSSSLEWEAWRSRA